MARQYLQQEVREETLKNKLVETQAKNQLNAAQINRLQKQKGLIAESLANTEYERARQVQLLMDAQRVGGVDNKDVISGKSNLLQT